MQRVSFIKHDWKLKRLLLTIFNFLRTEKYFLVFLNRENVIDRHMREREREREREKEREKPREKERTGVTEGERKGERRSER